MAIQLSRNKLLVIVVKIYTEAVSKFAGLVQFSLIFYFQRFCPGWQVSYIVNMSDSIKTGIISIASKNGDHIKKRLKISHQKNLNSRINYDETAVTQRKFI